MEISKLKTHQLNIFQLESNKITLYENYFTIFEQKKTKMNQFLLLTSFFLSSQIIGQNCNLDYQKSYKWKTHNNLFFNSSRIYDQSNDTLIKISENTAFNAYESRSAASDEEGNLLFYTNGVSVYDSNGDTISIPGGRLLSGAEIENGNMSSSQQGTMIVKHPLNQYEYYIFTGDDAVGGSNGITNGLNFNIYNKNNKTISPSKRLGNFRTTEHLTATWHSNGKDIWIITHESIEDNSSDKFLSYLLTEDSISETPVESNLGFIVSHKKSDSEYSNERGELKISWDGKKAAVTFHCGQGTWNPSESIGLMDFDNSTGKFSNYIGIGTNNVSFSLPKFVEFSTNDEFLFTCLYGISGANELGYFDLSNYNYQKIYTPSEDEGLGSLYTSKYGEIMVGDFQNNGWGYKDSLLIIENTNDSTEISITKKYIGDEAVSYGINNSFIAPYCLTNQVSSKDLIETSIFPNPADRTINIVGYENPIIEVMSTSGQLLFKSNFIGNNHKVNITDLTTGIYILRVVSENKGLTSSKIIVKK